MIPMNTLKSGDVMIQRRDGSEYEVPIIAASPYPDGGIRITFLRDGQTKVTMFDAQTAKNNIPVKE